VKDLTAQENQILLLLLRRKIPHWKTNWNN